MFPNHGLTLKVGQAQREQKRKEKRKERNKEKGEGEGENGSSSVRRRSIGRELEVELMMRLNDIQDLADGSFTITEKPSKPQP